MKSKKPLRKLALLFLASSLSGCIHLDVVPVTLDVKAKMAYVRPTNPSKPRVDLDLTKPEQFMQLHKFTCFSADDLAQIERALNKCH